MARKPPPGVPAGAIPIQLFPNQGGGFGYGVTKNASNPEGYDRTINMSVDRDGQTLSPSFAARTTAIGGTAPGRVSQIFAWRTSARVPYALAAIDTLWYIDQNGTTSAETVAGVFTSFGACFHDDGSGTEYLYAGADPTVAGAFIARRTQAAVWTRDADVRAKYLVSAAGALWRTTSDYQISKCPAGSEPFTIGSWGSALQVGTNYAKITALGALGAAPIVFKEDGIYPYNEADTRFENAFPVDPHPDNFPFVKSDNAGGIYTALHDGTLVHITRFGQITTQHYLDGKTPGRDTPRGAITDVVVWGDLLFAYVAPGWRKVKPLAAGATPQLTVLVSGDSGGTFTDYSNNAMDGSYATVVPLNALPGSGVGWLLIGADAPFLLADLQITVVNAIVQTLIGGISTGVGAFTTVVLADSTASEATLFANNTPFAQFGDIAIATAATGADPLTATWVTDTYKAKTKYWLRITLSLAAALSATVSIAEMAIVFKRAAPAPVLASFAHLPAFEASGQAGKIIAGRRTPNGVVWDDIYTVDSQIGNGSLVVAQTPAPNSVDASLTLITGQGTLFHFPLPNFLRPTSTDYPLLARDSNTVGAAPLYYPSAVDLGDIYRLKAIECLGAEFTDGVDQWGFSYRWDETSPWSTWESKLSGRTLFEVDGREVGRVLHTAFQILDTVAVDPRGPYGREIIAWVEPVQGQFEEYSTQPARAVPEVT